MSWIALLLGLILTSAGGVAVFYSLDLLPTELGLLYAVCGAIGLSGGFITIAIGLLIRRVDALRRDPARNDGRPLERPDPIMPPLTAGIEPAIVPEPGVINAGETDFSGFSPATAPEPSAMLDGSDDQETPVNENRRGHLPSLDAPEPVAAEPAPPKLVGRYGAGSASYSIFSDGSIEAETEQGAFKFASMSDFKAFIAAKRS